MNEIWDKIGISTSVVCALHCLLTPLAVAFIPILDQTLGHGWFHWGVVIVAVPTACWALWNGYQSHRQTRVLTFGALGLFLVVAATALPFLPTNWEAPLIIVGGVTLATAHYMNLRQCQRCSHALK